MTDIMPVVQLTQQQMEKMKRDRECEQDTHCQQMKDMWSEDECKWEMQGQQMEALGNRFPRLWWPCPNYISGWHSQLCSI